MTQLQETRQGRRNTGALHIIKVMEGNVPEIHEHSRINVRVTFGYFPKSIYSKVAPDTCFAY